MITHAINWHHSGQLLQWLDSKSSFKDTLMDEFNRFKDTWLMNLIDLRFERCSRFWGPKFYLLLNYWFVVFIECLI